MVKSYDNLQALYDDGIIQHSDILVFWGKRGYGKSSLQSVFNVWFMQPKNAKPDLILSRQICEEINNAELDLRPPTDHLVFVDTFCRSFGPGLKKTLAYEFSALDFGLPNSTHPTGLLCPCGKYSFDEGQDLFDSHMGNLATFVSKCMELSRQPELFIMIAVQRPKRLPLDIRDLSTFIEPVSRKNHYNKYGRLVKTEWLCNIIYHNRNFENYEQSADTKYVEKQIKIVFNGNIYRCYNSRYFLPMFYAGLDETKVKTTTLVLEKCQDIDFSANGFREFHKKHTIDIPDTYRGKKDTEKKKKEA